MRKATRAELVESLAEVVSQACSGGDGELDSMLSYSYADALRILARERLIVIEFESGRRVVGKWVRHD